MKEWKPSASGDDPQPILLGLFTPARKRRLSTPSEQALGVAKTRLGTVFILFSIAWVLIGMRLSYLTLGGQAAKPIVKAEPSNTPASRADVTDRNGNILATSLPTISLCANSKSIIDPDQSAQGLRAVLPDLNAEKLDQDLRSGKQCAIIKRHLTPRQYYEVNKLGIAGLEFLPDERRIYPSGNLTAHVVGYTDIDNTGLSGIERSMNERLNENDTPVTLSVDLRIQSVLRRELSAAMNDYRAEASVGLVMDIQTGEIVSMVSLPDFDPGRAGAATDEQRFNRATLGVYEMGSTFKIFNTALALDTGTVKLSDKFDTVNPIAIGRYRIRDFEKEDKNLNVAEIFVRSSNIGSARMAQTFGAEKQRAFFEKLGLTEKPKIEILELGNPLVPSQKNWGETTTLTTSFGHGIAVNAVQMASAVATLINNGRPVHPTLLKREDSYEGDVNTVISPRTSAMLRGLMRLVVTHGTAGKANVEGYLVGGKTGTADKLGANRQYASNGRRSSFIGVFPMNAPKYIIFAMLDDPKGNARTRGYATAGWVVAPAVNTIVSQIGPLLGIAPVNEDLLQTTERQVLKPLGTEIVKLFEATNEKDYAAFETDSIQ